MHLDQEQIARDFFPYLLYGAAETKSVDELVEKADQAAARFIAKMQAKRAERGEPAGDAPAVDANALSALEAQLSELRQSHHELSASAQGVFAELPVRLASIQEEKAKIDARLDGMKNFLGKLTETLNGAVARLASLESSAAAAAAAAAAPATTPAASTQAAPAPVETAVAGAEAAPMVTATTADPAVAYTGELQSGTVVGQEAVTAIGDPSPPAAATVGVVSTAPVASAPVAAPPSAPPAAPPSAPPTMPPPPPPL